jgi:hypothetical protein
VNHKLALAAAAAASALLATACGIGQPAAPIKPVLQTFCGLAPSDETSSLWPAVQSASGFKLNVTLSISPTSPIAEPVEVASVEITLYGVPNVSQDKVITEPVGVTVGQASVYLSYPAPSMNGSPPAGCHVRGYTEG